MSITYIRIIGSITSCIFKTLGHIKNPLYLHDTESLQLLAEGWTNCDLHQNNLTMQLISLPTSLTCDSLKYKKIQSVTYGEDWAKYLDTSCFW